MRGGLMAPLKDLDAKCEGHAVCERIHYERQAVGLIRQPEGRHLLQTPFDGGTCKAHAASFSTDCAMTGCSIDAVD